MSKSGVQEQSYKKQDIVLMLITNRSFLLNVALSITGSYSRAEDIVQDVYIKIMESTGAELVYQPLAYLVRTVRNLAIDSLRRRTFESRHYVDEKDGLNILSPYNEPEIHTIHHDLLDRISSMLASLPLRMRTAFEMVRFHGCTLKETAADLKVSQTLVHLMVRDITQRCLDYV